MLLDTPRKAIRQIAGSLPDKCGNGGPAALRPLLPTPTGKRTEIGVPSGRLRTSWLGELILGAARMRPPAAGFAPKGRGMGKAGQSVVSGRCTVGLLFLTLTLLSTFPAYADTADADLQFGMVVSFSDSTGCMAGSGLRLALGDSVTVLAPELNQPLPGRVLQKLRGECIPNQGVFGDSVNAYALTLEAAPDTEWAPALGVSGAHPAMRIQGNRVLFWVPGLPDTFIARGCTSMEGFHVFVRSAGRLLYHEYYYVPWSTEPDCTDEDFIDVPLR